MASTLRDRAAPFPIGAKIGRYKLLQKPGVEDTKHIHPLGHGNTSLVFLAEQQLLGGKVVNRALKLFSPTNELKNKKKQRSASYGSTSFLDEIEAISQLTHQNIVKIVDAGYLRAKQPFYVMEYVEGDTLETLLQSPNRLSNSWAEAARKDPYLVLRIAQQICFPLVYLHSLRRFHFDLAPKNIFIRNVNGKPHILLGDLGVSRYVPTIEDSQKEPGKTIYIAGTRAYTPSLIEPYRGREASLEFLAKYAPHWDVFALAKVVGDLIEGWDLNDSPELEALKIICARMSSSAELLSADRAYSELARLRPSQVLTAEVEEISTDAIGKRSYIPIPLQAVPTSPRVKSLLDHPALTRLQLVPQLLLYRSLTPGGVHTVYEHMLGCYALLLRCLAKLLSYPRFRATFSRKELQEAIVTILLLKITSCPFDRILYSSSPYSPKEQRVLILELLNYERGKTPSLYKVLSDSFDSCDLNSVLGIVCNDLEMKPYQKAIAGLIRSSLDVRVMDYLTRDSHHTGVPAGSGVDIGHIVENLIWSKANDSIGVTRAGVFSVEHLLTARYWMFARLYWNQGNRSITAMLRHVVSDILDSGLITRAYLARKLMSVDERGALDALHELWRHTAGYSRDDLTIVDLLRDPRPHTYPLLIELFTMKWSGDVSRNRTAMAKCEKLGFSGPEVLRREFYGASSLARKLGPSKILFDVPIEHPRKLGEDISVEVSTNEEHPLAQISGIAGQLPQAFFDTVVRLRVYHHPDIDETTASLLAGEVKEFLDNRFLH